MRALTLSGFVFSAIAAFGQQTYYDVTAGNGDEIRFWQDDSYKIHDLESEFNELEMKLK